MPASVIRKRKLKRSVAKAAAKKAVRKTFVEIAKPCSPEATEKAFGVSARRSRDIKRLVDEALA